MNPADRALAIADRIADGSAIDWTVADATITGPVEQGVFEQLKAIAALAALHRAPTGDLADASAAHAHRWGPLAIAEKIGEGRFGQVYLAWDARLQRRVALKLLLAAPGAAASSPEHAIEEARLLAKIRHPNVLAVHGAECADGQVGIWTEFIEGRTLEALLNERGPMPPDDVVAIGLDLCRALGAVHDAGLLHRDVKAQNVMRETGGRIVLMDFGTGHDLDARPARPGDLSGTPLYLAPEILAGNGATPASDVYALSVLLFRLLTGEYPVPGRTLDDVRKRHREGVVSRLGDARPNLPPALVNAIHRGLEPDPARRWTSAANFGDALTRAITPAASAPRQSRWRLAVAAAILVGLSSLATWQWMVNHPRPVLTLTDRDWVLVADFENGTGDPQFDDISHSVLERELSNSPFVRVMPQERIDSVLQLMKLDAGSALTRERAIEIAERDGEVPVIVTGRIDRAPDGYLLAASLVSPETGEMLRSFSEPASSAADLEGAMRRLASELRRRVGEPRAMIVESARRLEQVTAVSTKAVKTYTRAFDLGGRGEWDASLKLARQAVREDPAFASAWIWLAWTLSNTGHEAEAADAARNAVALSNGATEWERHWILGSAHDLAGEKPAAITEYQALIELAPAQIWAVRNLSKLTGDTKYFVNLAERLPNDPRAQFGAARHLYLFGASAADVELFWTRGSAIAPKKQPTWPLIPALLRLDAGDPQTASREIDRAAERSARSEGTNQIDRERFIIDLVLLRLGLGQTEAARHVVETNGLPGPTRSALVAVLDFYSGRTNEARAALTRSAPKPLIPRVPLMGVMTDLGLVSQMEAGLPNFKWDSHTLAWIQGETAFGRRKFDRVLAVLKPALPDLATVERLSGNGGATELYYRASLTTANAQVEQGVPAQAVDTLRAAIDRRLRPSAGSEVFRLGVLSRLAVLERRLGRTPEADAVDAKLKQALQLAEPAFVKQLALVAAR